MGAAAAGVTWVAPVVLSTDAVAQGSVCNVGNTGFFTWNRAAYTNAQRSGSPGGGSAMTTAGGWTSHPTFTTTSYTTTTPITITYLLQGTTFLNTSGSTPEGHGVSNAGGSAVFKSYRVSKDGNPTLGNVMTIVIQFSAEVRCPVVTIGDLDNSLPAGVNGCTGAASPGPNFWADRLTATASTGLGGTGAARTVQRIAGAPGSGTNVSPGVGSTGPWSPNLCAGIAQSSNVSDLTLQVIGPAREIRLNYVSNYFDNSGNGNQHIALGDISFTYA